MELRTEDEAILAEIREAFRGVTRECGVSWSESVVVDDYGSEQERAAARNLDKDTSWQEVADDPEWRIDRGVGGLSFLDPIGYRYYLPACMTVAVRGGFRDSLLSSLILPRWKWLADYTREQWSLLDHTQQLCVRHFVEHMIRTTAEPPDGSPPEEFEAKEWRKALGVYWKNVPDLPPA